jgi:hypothetical protein
MKNETGKLPSLFNNKSSHIAGRWHEVTSFIELQEAVARSSEFAVHERRSSNYNYF